MLGLLQTCYICLQSNCKNLLDVVEKDVDNITYLYKLQVCISEDLKENNVKQICPLCVKRLRLAHRFREMVLQTQNALQSHGSEIISGLYVADSKISKIKAELLEDEYVSKQKHLKGSRCVKTSIRRSLRTPKPLKFEDGSDEYIYDPLPLDSNNSDYFIETKNLLVNTSEISNTNNNNSACNIGIEEVKSETGSDQLRCANCNTSPGETFIEQHLCKACNCDNGYKDEMAINSKNDECMKRRRGRPRKKINPAPEMIYECYHCSMIFNKRWKLQKHISRVHSEKKQYICTYCNKGFKQSYHLREHLTCHTGERNYACSFCDKSFQRISSMKRHIRSHEAAPGQKTKRTPFLCTVCGKNFPFSNGVQRHMRVHLGIKNHECNICQRRFTQSTHLHVHMRTHTGEKPYVCDTCGDAFSLNASLQKHMIVHQSVNKTNVLDCK